MWNRLPKVKREVCEYNRVPKDEHIQNQSAIFARLAQPTLVIVGTDDDARRQTH